MRVLLVCTLVFVGCGTTEVAPAPTLELSLVASSANTLTAEIRSTAPGTFTAKLSDGTTILEQQTGYLTEHISWGVPFKTLLDYGKHFTVTVDLESDFGTANAVISYNTMPWAPARVTQYQIRTAVSYISNEVRGTFKVWLDREADVTVTWARCRPHVEGTGADCDADQTSVPQRGQQVVIEVPLATAPLGAINESYRYTVTTTDTADNRVTMTTDLLYFWRELDRVGPLGIQLASDCREVVLSWQLAGAGASNLTYTIKWSDELSTSTLRLKTPSFIMRVSPLNIATSYQLAVQATDNYGNKVEFPVSFATERPWCG